MELLQSMIRAYSQCEPEIKLVVEEMASAYVLCNDCDKQLLFDTIMDGLYPFLTSKERSELYNGK